MEMARKGISPVHHRLAYLPLNQFPTANNTGTIPGVARTSSGTVSVSANNQVVQNLNITGQVLLNGHTGVKVFNCQIDGNGTTGFGVDGDSTDASVLNCEIFNHGNDPGGEGGNAAILTQGIARRNKIYAWENGIVTQDGNISTDNYIFNLANNASATPHIDGIAVQGNNGVLVTVAHNTIYSWDTSCVFIKNDGSVQNANVINNLMLNQDDLDHSGHVTSSTVYDDDRGASGVPISGISFTNNIMEPGSGGSYGEFWNTLGGNIPVWSGNINFSTQANIPIPTINT